MEELVISPDFTMEDIQKIREYHEERRELIGDEAFLAEIAALARSAQARMRAMREEPVAV